MTCDRRRSLPLAAIVLVPALAATATTDAQSVDCEVVPQLATTAAPIDPFAARVRGAAADDGLFVIEELAIGDGHVLDVELEAFPIVTPETRFVLGTAGGADRSWPYDPSRVSIYRGSVVGQPGSHVFIAASATGATGYVDLGSDRRWISTRPRTAGRVDSTRPLGLPPGLSLCGQEEHPELDLRGEATRDFDPPAEAVGAGGILNSTRVVELAVETDYEFFELIGDVDEAMDYLVELYAAVSDIFVRDVNARLVLTFVRVWDTPDDLFNEPNPLGPFVDYWNENMTDVERDVAQFLSGRRDLPWGGIAYLGALCGNFGYSVVGYALGFMPDVDAPSVYHFDVPVTAHELGHNFAANHTHFYGLDNCNMLDNTPQRGTIMSYCSQTVSGGNSITDLRFHSFVQEQMRGYLVGVECADFDCNGNGIDDAEEISGGLVDDRNGNGVPDTCEDCNANGVLDPDDIDQSISEDVNENGVPDECEADCNENGIPDDFDILMGLSTDAWGDGIPDECEADCDGDGMSDYSEIQGDLGLDIDRDTILDSCQDCDGDGTIDIDALEGAHDVWIASHDADGTIREFHSISGALVRVSDADQIVEGNDLVISAEGRVLVASGDDDRVVEYNRFGAYVGDIVGAGVGGLDDPTGIAFGPDGNIYVVSRGSDSVLRFDRDSGASIDAFVPAGSGGLTQPFSLIFGADGLLYVNGGDDQVRRYDAGTGAFVDVFVSAFDNGGLSNPRGMVFKPNGNLLIASHETDEILEYDGVTGNYVGQFNKGGTETALTFDEPWGLRVGPNGNVFASRHHIDNDGGPGGGLLYGDIAGLHVNSSRIYEFDIDSGNFIRSYVTGNDTNLWSPTGFDFMPDFGLDCNLNAVPDNCDIAAGVSDDENGNGVPDECESVPSPDLNGDGVVDGVDLGLLLGNWYGEGVGDLNGDGIVDGADLGLLLAAWTG